MMSTIRSDPELNDYDHTYVFAENIAVPDDQTLSMPMFSTVFRVLKTFYPSGTIRSARNRIIIHDTTRDFEHPVHRFWSPSDSKSAISEMLSSIEIPFPWDNNLFWKDWRRNGGVLALRLNCATDMVARVSEFSRRMIVSAAETGCKRLRMVVTIERRVLFSHPNYELMVSIGRILEDLRSFRNSSRALGAVFDDNRTEFGWKPAAKSAVEALKRWICDDQSRVTCTICTEEVMSGSHMIGMPCSHMFHGDCILEWLKKNHTCPLCRFSLPID